LRKQIARSVFVSTKFHFPPTKTFLPNPAVGAVAPKSQPFLIVNDMENERKKRGRKPKDNPQTNRLMFRLNGKDRKRFLQMFERSGMKSYSAFMADCILNRPLKVVEVNQSAIDFVMLLSDFFAQFRAVKSNFNQAHDALVRNFGERKALEMIGTVAQSTREFGLLQRTFEELVTQFREQLFNRNP
jgi:hypothetical protein